MDKRKMTAIGTSVAADEGQPSYVRYTPSIHDMEKADKLNREGDGKRQGSWKRRETVKFRRGAGCPFQRAALLGKLPIGNGAKPQPRRAQ